MTKETKIQIRNNSYESMLKAQYMMECATTDFQKNVAEILYELSWAMYQIMIEKRTDNGN